jgi:hypothetical protein
VTGFGHHVLAPGEDYRLALVVLAAGGKVTVPASIMEGDPRGFSFSITPNRTGGVVLTAAYRDPEARAVALTAIGVFLWRVFNDPPKA